MQRYEHRLARSIATLANVLDPDVFVLGGGMSNLPQIYETLSRLVPNWTLGGEFTTPIRPAKHGDSSGVRGAAWLWLHLPVGYYKTTHDPRWDWCFKTEPEPELNNRSLGWPRGRVLGGSSAINGLLHVRGQPEDYDGWAAAGCDG